MNNAYNVAEVATEYDMLQQGILSIQMTTLSLQVCYCPSPRPRPTPAFHSLAPHSLAPHPRATHLFHTHAPHPRFALMQGGRPASRYPVNWYCITTQLSTCREQGG